MDFIRRIKYMVGKKCIDSDRLFRPPCGWSLLSTSGQLDGSFRGPYGYFLTLTVVFSAIHLTSTQESSAGTLS